MLFSYLDQNKKLGKVIQFLIFYEFCLAQLGMYFTIKINCSEIKKKKLRFIFKKRNGGERFYQYILGHGFCKNIADNDVSDISILNSTFINIMTCHVDQTNMYYCIYWISFDVDRNFLK